MCEVTPTNEASPPLTDAQKRELRARLAYHRAHPDEPGVTLDEIRRKLSASRRHSKGR